MTNASFFSAVNDEPTKDDLVGLDPYLDVLADFIQQCETPMTIALQGGWGSGKTSAIRMLKEKIENRSKSDVGNEGCWQIEFNVWQYAHFDLGDQLVLSLMGRVLAEVDNRLDKLNKSEDRFDGIKARIKSLLGTVNSMSSHALFSAIGLPNVDTSLSVVSSILQKFLEKSESKDSDLVRVLTDMREELCQGVRVICGEDEGAEFSYPGHRSSKKLIIYVDDLDRVKPEQAVTLLEAIKVFLNIPYCVIVLAVDFDVVVQGIRAKYGELLNEKMAYLFFDKIIQVPFNLPVSQYDISRLLKNFLGDSVGELTEGDVVELSRLISSSLGPNPRAVKRLLNTYFLLRGMPLHGIGGDSESILSPVHTLAMLCLQQAYPEDFKVIVNKVGDDNFDPEDEWGDMWAEVDEAVKRSSSDADKSKIFRDELQNLFFKDEKGSGILDRGACFKLAVAKTALVAVNVEHEKVDLMDRGGEFLDYDDRVSLLGGASDEYKNLIRSFEESLISQVGPVRAHVPDENKWKYGVDLDRVEESALSDRFKRSRKSGPLRFLELHFNKSSLRLEFGDKLIERDCRSCAYKAALAASRNVDGWDNLGLKISLRPSGKPLLSVRSVDTEEKARAVAQLVGRLYVESGEVSPCACGQSLDG